MTLVTGAPVEYNIISAPLLLSNRKHPTNAALYIVIFLYVLFQRERWPN